MQQGIVSKIFSWIAHPINSEGTPSEWLAGLVIILLGAFLWSHVVEQVLD